MSIADDHTPDRSRLVYRYHERLYRLALLLSGAPKAAAALTEAAFRRLPADTPADAAEPALLRALLAGQPPRQRWAFATPDLSHTTLGATQAAGLLAELAARTPAARLALGLAYIAGSAPDEIEALLAHPGLDAAAELAAFRAAAARALGLLPPDADIAEVERIDRWAEGQLNEADQLAVRRDLIERADLRAVRDGLLATRELLPRAIPALFAAAPPHTLTEKLLKLAQPRRLPARHLPARRAQLALAAGILLLAAAIVAVPSWLAGRAARPSAPATATAPADMIEAAIHRFDRPPVSEGVLHELYRVERDSQPAVLIERWYDYASPNRLAIRISAEGSDGPPLMQVSSDGRSLVQFRYDHARSFGEESVDIQLSQSEAQAVVPLLRGQPIVSSFARDSDQPGDLGPLFLAQARASGARLLGQTTLHGRPAVLLTYETDAPPGQPRLSQPARVVLTLDTQMYALLDASVLPIGAAEGTAVHAVRAQQVELLAQAGAAPFTLPTEPGVASRIGIGSVRFPFIDGNEQLTIDALALRQPGSLLAPLALPDTRMRGIAFKNGGPTSDDIVLLYEGEFQNIILLSRFRPGASQQLGEEQSAGAFRYRLVANRSFGGALAALVYRPEAPSRAIGVILNDELATDAERQARLSALIASLAPIDDQTLPALRQTFQPPDSTAGKS